MKFSMQLTLDGLVRAMRVKAHDVADAVESGVLKAGEAGLRREARGSVGAHGEGDGHDLRDA